jgi:acetyl-CoA C-acetyltransferase
MKEVYIISAKRTPIGGFLGSLSNLSATHLGATAIRGVLENVIDAAAIDSVYMGNVLSALLGQSPARQAAKHAGVPDKADATTINKVCSSGMKATMIGAQQIELGIDHLVVTGGMESMSNVPHYAAIRKSKLGHSALTDGLLKDGLTDAYSQLHMGNAAELCAKHYHLSREMQDEYALRSYQRAKQATLANYFSQEILEIAHSGAALSTDEDIDKLISEKVPALKPTFDINGTITAANASNLNDGAAALLLASEEVVLNYKLKPLARIVSYADAAQSPDWFTTAPSLAIPIALQRAKLSFTDIDFFEINEAYAAVALANQKILKIPDNKLNVNGGAVAMGHPIGASGARILVTLIHILKQRNARYGLASICNGGGGASAMVIENL